MQGAAGGESEERGVVVLGKRTDALGDNLVPDTYAVQRRFYGWPCGTWIASGSGTRGTSGVEGQAIVPDLLCSPIMRRGVDVL